MSRPSAAGVSVSPVSTAVWISGRRLAEISTCSIVASTSRAQPYSPGAVEAAAGPRAGVGGHRAVRRLRSTRPPAKRPPGAGISPANRSASCRCAGAERGDREPARSARAAVHRSDSSSTRPSSRPGSPSTTSVDETVRPAPPARRRRSTASPATRAGRGTAGPANARLPGWRTGRCRGCARPALDSRESSDRCPPDLDRAHRQLVAGQRRGVIVSSSSGIRRSRTSPAM